MALGDPIISPRLNVPIHVQDELRIVCRSLGFQEKPAGRLALLPHSCFWCSDLGTLLFGSASFHPLVLEIVSTVTVPSCTPGSVPSGPSAIVVAIYFVAYPWPARAVVALPMARLRLYGLPLAVHFVLVSGLLYPAISKYIRICRVLAGRSDGHIFLNEYWATRKRISGPDWDLLKAIGLERFCPPFRSRCGLLRGWP